jgi:hypothetical protein
LFASVSTSCTFYPWLVFHRCEIEEFTELPKTQNILVEQTYGSLSQLFELACLAEK